LAPLGEQSLKPDFIELPITRSTSTTKKRTGIQNGITVLNSPEQLMQIIGEIGVILVNLSNETL
jgi:hypothetical protein